MSLSCSFINSGKERNSNFGASVRRPGMRMSFRPPDHSAAGGLIERAIGTFMTKLRLLPGSSYSKILGQAPKRVHKSARLTMAEVYEIPAREVTYGLD
jgi:hypothetical protein